jgi:hypothetical protein
MSRSRVLRLDNLQQFQAINVLSDPGSIGGPVVIPNAIKVMLVWTLGNGRTGRNVLGMTVPGSFTATAAIAESLRAAFTAGSPWSSYAAFLANTVALARVEILDIRQANMTVVASTGAAAPGTSASPELPDEVAAAVTIRTALTGPANRGRFYLPGFATNALGAGNIIAAGAVTAITNFALQIGTAVAGQGMSWVVLHPARQAYTGVTGTQHPARTPGSVPITSVTVRDNHWDSQRRRGLK